MGIKSLAISKCALEGGESLLGASQVPGLQGLPDGVEILFALIVGKGISARKRAILAQRDNRIEGGLSAGQVARPERLPECLHIALPSLEIFMDLQVQRTTVNS